MPKFGKSAKNFFLLEKNPTSIFKIGGILGKKCSANKNPTTFKVEGNFGQKNVPQIS